VEPRFTNLIRSWRPFVNRNVRKPKLSWLTSIWHSRADTLSLPLLPVCVFAIRDAVRHPRLFARKTCSWTELFVNRGVREPRFHCTRIYDISTLRVKITVLWGATPCSLVCTVHRPGGKAINCACVRFMMKSTCWLSSPPVAALQFTLDSRAIAPPPSTIPNPSPSEGLFFFRPWTVPAIRKQVIHPWPSI
jgi:hypothetical protein